MDDLSSFPSRFQKSPADAHTRHRLTDQSTLVTYFPTGAKVVFSVKSGDPHVGKGVFGTRKRRVLRVSNFGDPRVCPMHSGKHSVHKTTPGHAQRVSHRDIVSRLTHTHVREDRTHAPAGGIQSISHLVPTGHTRSSQITSHESATATTHFFACLATLLHALCRLASTTLPIAQHTQRFVRRRDGGGEGKR